MDFGQWPLGAQFLGEGDSPGHGHCSQHQGQHTGGLEALGRGRQSHHRLPTGRLLRTWGQLGGSLPGLYSGFSPISISVLNKCSHFLSSQPLASGWLAFVTLVPSVIRPCSATLASQTRKKSPRSWTLAQGYRGGRGARRQALLGPRAVPTLSHQSVFPKVLTAPLKA